MNINSPSNGIHLVTGIITISAVIIAGFSVTIVKAESEEGPPLFGVNDGFEAHISKHDTYYENGKESHLVTLQCTDNAIRTIEGNMSCERIKNIKIYAWTSQTDTVVRQFKDMKSKEKGFWVEVPTSAWGATFRVNGEWINNNASVEWRDSSKVERIRNGGASGNWDGFAWSDERTSQKPEVKVTVRKSGNKKDKAWIILKCEQDVIRTIEGRKHCKKLSGKDIQLYAWVSQKDAVVRRFFTSATRDENTFAVEVPSNAWGGTFKVDGEWINNEAVKWHNKDKTFEVERVREGGVNSNWYGFSWHY